MANGTNFDYLRDIDKNLYEIISEAENLYRNEFFEQSITQTRRFGEHMCRNVLGKSRTTEITFDEMLSTLKDKISGSEQEKEFIEDLYFLKKHGNASVHSSSVKKDGAEALECLQRAFEAGINYCVHFKNGSLNILKREYDINLLVTGKRKTKKLEDHIAEKTKISKPRGKSTNKKKTSSKPKPKKKQSYSMKPVPPKKGISPFWIIVGISFIIALFAVLFIIL